MAEFPTYEEIAKNVAKKALDDILYQGKSIREWVKIIMEQEPKTDVLDKIKADIEKAMADFYEYNDYQIGVRQGFRFALEIIGNYEKGEK